MFMAWISPIAVRKTNVDENHIKVLSTAIFFDNFYTRVKLTDRYFVLTGTVVSQLFFREKTFLTHIKNK